QQVTDGEDTQQSAIVVSHRQMAEVTFQHGGKRFARPGAPRSHLNRSGHQFADGSVLRVGAAERHLAEYIAFRENSGDPVFGIDHSNSANVMVEHFVDGIGYGGFERDRRDFAITQFQYAHKHLLWRSATSAGRMNLG